MTDTLSMFISDFSSLHSLNILVLTQTIQDKVYLNRWLDFAYVLESETIEEKYNPLISANRTLLYFKTDVNIPSFNTKIKYTFLKYLTENTNYYNEMSLISVVQESQRTELEEFLLQLYYHNIVTWESNILSLVNDYVKNRIKLCFKTIPTEVKNYSESTLREQCVKDGLKLANFGINRYGSEEILEFADSLEKYILHCIKHKNCNEETLKCLIFMVLQQIPNGVNTEVTFKKNNNMNMDSDIIYTNDCLNLIIKLKRSKLNEPQKLFRGAKQARQHAKCFKGKFMKAYFVFELRETSSAVYCQSICHMQIDFFIGEPLENPIVIIHSLRNHENSKVCIDFCHVNRTRAVENHVLNCLLA